MTTKPWRWIFLLEMQKSLLGCWQRLVATLAVIGVLYAVHHDLACLEPKL